MMKNITLFTLLILFSVLWKTALSAAPPRDTILVLPVTTDDQFPDSLLWIKTAYDDFLQRGLAANPSFHIISQRPAYKSWLPSVSDVSKQCTAVRANYAIIFALSTGQDSLTVHSSVYDAVKSGSLKFTQTQIAPGNLTAILSHPALIIIQTLKNKFTKERMDLIRSFLFLSKNPLALQRYYSARSLENRGERPDSAETLLTEAVRLDTLFIEGYAELARVQRQIKKYDAALATYNRLIRLDSLRSDWYRAVADIYYYHKDQLPAAKRYYQRAIQVNPKDLIATIQSGYCEYVSKEYELASYQARKALTIDSLNSDAYNLLGISAISLGDTLRGEEYFLRAARINPKEISARKNLARLYQEKGHNDRALSLLKESASADPTDAAVRLSLATLYYQKENYFQSALEFICALLLKPEYENSRTNPVQILSLLTQNKKNLRLISVIADSLKIRSLEAETDSDEEFWTRAALGYLQLYFLDKPGEAVNHFQSIRHIRKDVPRLYYLIGEALFRLEKWNLSAQAYTRYAAEAVDHFSYARTLLMLAKIALRQNRPDEAELTALKSLRFFPNAESYFVYGTALSRNRKFTEAAEQFRKAVNLFPNYIDAYVELGNTLFLLNQIGEAIVAIKKAAELDSLNPLPRQSLAALFLQQGDYAQALNESVKAFDLARKQKKEYPALYGIYGEILYQQKQYNDALKAFQTQTKLDTVPAEPLFRLACIYAITRKNDRALETLEKLFARGFRLFSRIEQEPAFATLKDKKKFKELIARYRKQYEEELLKKIIPQGK